MFVLRKETIVILAGVWMAATAGAASLWENEGAVQACASDLAVCKKDTTAFVEELKLSLDGDKLSHLGLDVEELVGRLSDKEKVGFETIYTDVSTLSDVAQLRSSFQDYISNTTINENHLSSLMIRLTSVVANDDAKIFALTLVKNTLIEAGSRVAKDRQKLLEETCGKFVSVNETAVVISMAENVEKASPTLSVEDKKNIAAELKKSIVLNSARTLARSEEKLLKDSLTANGQSSKVADGLIISYARQVLAGTMTVLADSPKTLFHKTIVQSVLNSVSVTPTATGGKATLSCNVTDIQKEISQRPWFVGLKKHYTTEFAPF